MVLSIEELKKHMDTSAGEEALADKLRALELLIRSFTHNNFQNRAVRTRGDCRSDGTISCNRELFVPGDTLQISESSYMPDMLCTVKSVDGYIVTVGERLYDEKTVLVTKVEYPADVKMGVINMLRWDLENRDKVGIQSETISRHSVTYFNLDGDNAVIGYPRALTGFLRPYMKARF